MASKAVTLVSGMLAVASSLACARGRVSPVDDVPSPVFRSESEAQCAEIERLLAHPPPADTSTATDVSGLPWYEPPPPGTKATIEMQRNVKRAEELMENPDGPGWDEAHELLLRVYHAFPSPRVLPYLAKNAEHLERPGEAIDAYERALREPQLTADQRRVIEQRLASLRAHTATVVLRGLEADAWIDDRRESSPGQTVDHVYVARGTAATLRVQPGYHQISFRLFHAETWKVELAGGTTTEHVFVPTLPSRCLRR